MAENALFALDLDVATSLATDPAGFVQRHGIVLAPHQHTTVAIAAATAAMLLGSGAVMPWCGYLALEGPMRRVVGTCGFKGAPDADGAVEIAYFAFPGEEGRGVATAMAEALLGIASDAGPPVAIVRAHTLPERNASCRILEKLGFRQLGEVIDPEDGTIWRWERLPRRAMDEAPGSR